MKQKSLFILASLMMLSLTASAQWTKPTMSTFTEMATDGNTVQFLYNVGTERFLVGANEWNTRASVGERGDSIKVRDLQDGHYAISAIAVVNAGKTAWGYISCASWDAMWMDRSFQEGSYPGTDKWMITKTGDTYKFRNDNITDEEPFTWGVAEIFKGQADNRLYIYDATQTYTKTVDGETFDGQPAFEGEFYDEWKFVSKDDYLAFDAQLSAFYAAESLKAALDKAEAENPGIDLAAQKAVYNNTASTAEQLKAAEAEIAAVIVEYLKNKEASVDNPISYTASITNPTFDIVGDFTGWKGSGFGAGGDKSTNAERWCCTFDTYQDIEGLPEGVYKLQCNGFVYDHADFATDYKAWKEGTPTNTRLYLSSHTNGYYFNSIAHISQGAMQEEVVSGDRTTTITDDAGVEKTIYGPNSMVAADKYFHDGRNAFINNVYTALADGETLRIGVSSDVSTDWSVFDDFELIYYGNDITAYKMWAQMLVEQNEVNTDAFVHGAPEKAFYDQVMAGLSSAESKEAIIDAAKNITLAVDSLQKSKAAYEAYIAKCKWAEEQLNDMDEQGYLPEVTAPIADYVQASAFDNEDVTAEHNYPNGCMNYIIDLENEAVEGRLSTAQITEETAWLEALVTDIRKNGMDEGVDVTSLLTNPSFADGFTGWTNLNGRAEDFSALNPPIPNNVEVYGLPVDCRQTITGVQPGVYAITVKAFERPAGEGQWTGDEPSKVFLFMNQFQTPVQHIAKGAIKAENAIDGQNCYLTQTYESGFGCDRPDVESEFGYVPNGMVGAAVAFNAGRYEQTCYGLVGDDGVMTIGLTSNGVACHWVLWADFHLIYMAKNEEALASLIEYYVGQAEKVSDAGAPDLAALDQAVENAQAAEGGDAMYTALFELVDAYNAAVESADLYDQAASALTNLEDAQSEFNATASQEAKEKAEKVKDDYQAGITEKSYSGKEMAEILAKIKNAIAGLKVPDTSNPPVDFTGVIENADFTVGNSDPWIITVGAANKGYQNNNVYTNEANGIELNQFIETWRSGAILDDGYIYQALQALPAGQYKLECDGIASWQNNASTVVEGVELVMAEADSPENVTDYAGTAMHTASGKPEHYEVTFMKTTDSDTPLFIGLRVNGTNANWVAADNFKLTYLGASGTKKGDVNEDGAVNINDVVAIINVMAGTASWQNANVNGDPDGAVDINDVVAVINIMAGK